VCLVGAVGADRAGEGALAELAADGVDTSAVAVLADQPTGAALIVVDARGENQIAIGPGANGAVTPALVERALRPRLDLLDLVLVSTEIPLDAVLAALAAARAAGVRAILNPAPVIAGLGDALAFGPLVTPNEGELAALAALAGGDADDVGERLVRVVRRTAAPALVTLGARGCRGATPEGGTFDLPALRPAAVIDTTGAGDTFNGVFAAALADGLALAAAARRAVVAASLSVTAAGARGGMPDGATIDAALAALQA